MEHNNFGIFGVSDILIFYINSDGKFLKTKVVEE